MSSLVSVITPCYSSEKFISQTIESVIFQTFKDWEMLIIDDCSTDNSASIIKEYCLKDNRIKYFKTDSSSGSPSLPRNIGIEKAQGQYIAFLDSDDIWLPTKLERQLEYINQSNVAIVFSNYKKMNEKGEIHKQKIIAPETVTYRKLLQSNYLGCLTVMYDTSKVGKMYFKKSGHEDLILWLSILKKGFIAYNTNTCEALYRVMNNSVSSNKLKVLKWQWRILRQEEGLNLISTCYYFTQYAIKAFIKSRK